MLPLFKVLRDDMDAEQRLPGCVQKLNLPFGVLFEPSGDIADQIADDLCDLGPYRIAICNIDAEIRLTKTRESQLDRRGPKLF
jgi:hypothetical protein